MAFGLFKSKTERVKQAKEASARYAENDAKFQAAYDRICADTAAALEATHKPKLCNTITATAGASGDTPFHELEHWQWSFSSWEVWRHEDKLYLYSPEVQGYPDPAQFGLYIGDSAPMLLSIHISDIQYFKMEGGIVQKTEITGGQLKQNRRTGKISQTPIHSKTNDHDQRYTRVTTHIQGIIKHLDFGPDAYDVLYSLIPEKEYSRVAST